MKTHNYNRIALILIVVTGIAYITACGWSGAGETQVEPTSTQSPTKTALPKETPTPFPTQLPTPTIPPVSSNFKPAMTAADCLAADLPEVACTGVSANQQWVSLVKEFNGVEMVLVPAGCFQMGDNQGFDEVQPEHEVCISRPFWIDRTEVTVAQFADLLNGQPGVVENLAQWLDLEDPIFDINIQLVFIDDIWKPVPGDGQRPLGYVMWVGAAEFCSLRDGRLPTEAEWEYAARGPDSLLYPWGNELDTTRIFFKGTRNHMVGSIPEGASWVGALDMSGSLFEWTSSLYRPYPYDPEDGREADYKYAPVSLRVFKGSAWYHHHGMDFVESPARFEGPPDYGFWYHGVRCVQSIE